MCVLYMYIFMYVRTIYTYAFKWQDRMPHLRYDGI